MADRSVDLYKLLTKQAQGNGIKIVRAVTVEPDQLTFIFEGTKLAISAEIFEVPYTMYPIKKGDRFLTYPLHSIGPASHWALIQKLSGCTTCTAIMSGPDSLTIDGIDKTYTAADLILPYGVVFLAGQKVVITPVWDGRVKYAVLNRYA